MKFFSRIKGKKQPESGDEPSGNEKLPSENEQEASGENNIGEEVICHRMSYRAGNLQGLGKRESQEDSFCFVNALDVTMILEKGLLAVVADGMGGEKDGKLASETAVNAVRAEFAKFDYKADPARQLETIMRRACEAVYSVLKGEGGTTAVICLVYDEKLWFASVGDSFLYLMRNGQLSRLNREQNILHEDYLYLIRGGSMNPTPAREKKGNAAISQFLGLDELSDIDLLRRPLPLENGDVIMLCSDGVGGVLSTEEITECLQCGSPGLMCNAVENRILSKENPYQDNYTALIIQCCY